MKINKLFLPHLSIYSEDTKRMITKGKLAILVYLVSLTTITIAAPISEHYLFKYDSDHAYDVKLNDSTITWKSLSGPDKGQMETDNINRKNLSEDVDVIQWTENDGTFITVVLDRTLLNVVSSGKYSTDTWLWSGVAEKI